MVERGDIVRVTWWEDTPGNLLVVARVQRGLAYLLSVDGRHGSSLRVSDLVPVGRVQHIGRERLLEAARAFAATYQPGQPAVQRVGDLPVAAYVLPAEPGAEATWLAYVGSPEQGGWQIVRVGGLFFGIRALSDQEGDWFWTFRPNAGRVFAAPEEALAAWTSYLQARAARGGER